jgi:hypothetical protein
MQNWTPSGEMKFLPCVNIKSDYLAFSGHVCDQVLARRSLVLYLLSLLDLDMKIALQFQNSLDLGIVISIIEGSRTIFHLSVNNVFCGDKLSSATSSKLKSRIVRKGSIL